MTAADRPTVDYSEVLAGLEALHRTAPAFGDHTARSAFGGEVADFPVIEKLERAAREMEPPVETKPEWIGSLKVIGGARKLVDGSITATLKPWEFQGWLPLASPRVIKLNGALVWLDVEVLQGSIGIDIMASDGIKLLGPRFVARAGRQQLQLEIRQNEVRGVVFCNEDAPEVAARFKIHGASVTQFKAPAEDTVSAGSFLTEADSELHPEVSDFEALNPSPALVFHYLLGRGEIHRCRTLLRAERKVAGRLPAWLPERVMTLLEEAVSGNRQTTSAPTPSETPTSVLAPTLAPDLQELFALRPHLQGATLVPLHLELLEFGNALDLVSRLKQRPYNCTWQRRGLADNPTPRGLLRILVELIDERLADKPDALNISIVTEVHFTELTICSGMQHGDLQYREYSALSRRLLEALNDPRGTPPNLGHRLGQEDELVLRWDHQRPTAASLPDLSWRQNPDTGRIVHSGESGGTVSVEAGRCYKFAPATANKHNDMVEEAALLGELADLNVTPRLITSYATTERTAMSYVWEPGRPLSELMPRGTNVTESMLAPMVRQLSDALVQVNQRGIQHNDVRAENVLQRNDGTLCLIDFDQAVRTPDADDFGNEWGESAVCAGFGGLMRQLECRSSYLSLAGRLGYAWELGRFSAANSPGKHACYYDWQFGGMLLQGERPWLPRWKLLRHAFTAPLVPCAGRFLELGCNLGLLSVHAALEGWEATGLDHDGVAVEAAGQIAGALGVSARFLQGDLADPALFQELDETYDLVSALSVLHWLPDSGPIESFLRRQPRLLFEGHRALVDETAYLREDLGFATVVFLGYSERLRPVLFAQRQP